jgi:hypothetical protein
MQRFTCLVAVAVLLGMGSAARATQAVKIDVPRQGGAYTVDVHPDVLTVMFFQSDIVIAYSVQDPPDVVVKQHGQSLTVQPKPGVKHGSINIKTKAFTVGVLLRVVERAESAAIQVEFRDRDLERDIVARVDLEVEKRMLALQGELERDREALERDREALQALVREKAAHRIADGLRQRHHVQQVERGARNEHAILRVHRVVWIGPDAHVVFSVENRRPGFYKLAWVQLQVDGENVAEAISFPESKAAAQQELFGLVAPRTRSQGVALLPNAHLWKGKTVTLTALTALDGQTRQQPLTVTVSLP